MKTSTVFLCSARRYCFEGWTFEGSAGRNGFPWPLKKNGDPKEKAGRQFFQMLKRFDALPKAEKETHRMGGGCEVIRMKGVRVDAK
jgi:hypothetical protein